MLKKCETCGSYTITAADIEELRKSGYGHPDPVGEPGVLGVDGIPEVVLEPHRIGYSNDKTLESLIELLRKTTASAESLAASDMCEGEYMSLELLETIKRANDLLKILDENKAIQGD